MRDDDQTRHWLALIFLIGGGCCIGAAFGWQVGLGVALLAGFLKP